MTRGSTVSGRGQTSGIFLFYLDLSFNLAAGG
jgi:hypothetical protein